MPCLIPIALLLVTSLDPGSSRLRDGLLASAPAPSEPLPPATPGPSTPATPPASPVGPSPAGFAVDRGELVLPFEADSLGLDLVIEESVAHNLELRNRVIAVEVSEAQILAALGAFDLRFTAGVDASLQESTPRGSAFVFSTGSRSLGAYVGLSRRLETGGTLSLRLDLDRTLTSQPISFFDPSAGSAELASYNVRPTLTLTHPLLKGLGIKVNKAQETQARVAKSQAEAAAIDSAQNLIKDVITAYWDVLFAHRDLENKQRSRELAEEQLKRTHAQVVAGRLAPIEEKSVEQALAVRDSEVLLAENALLDRSLTLRTHMGQEFADRPVLGVLPTTDPAGFAPEPVDMKAEIDRALRSNPQVRQLELALDSKRVDELVNANQRLPQLDFTGSFSPTGRSVDTAPDPNTGDPGESGSWGEAFRNFINEDVRRDGVFAEFTVSGALDLTWDIQNRTARGNHKRVLAQLRQAELDLKQIRQTVASSVIRATSSLRTATKRLDVTRISVELATQNLAAEQARFDVGRSTNYDVLFRLDELSRAESDALSAQIEYLKAKVQLQALNGQLLSAYGLELPDRAP